jgi:serine/threonine protein kinase
MGKSFADELLTDVEPIDLPQEITVRFNIIERLGVNAFGDTYLLAEKDGSKRFVLKSLRQFELNTESDLLLGLEHRGLPKFEPQIKNGSSVFTLRVYTEGVSLEEYLENYPDVSEELTVHIIKELCDILEVLHSQPTPIIHRDITPSNVIIDPRDHSVTLIDFGASRKYCKESDCDTVAVATRGFAAPEQFGFAQTDARTDIYSLGIMLRYMLTGTIEQRRLISNRALEMIVTKCNALDPKNRFQSAGDLRKALLKTKSRTRRKISAAMALAACAVFAAGIAATMQMDFSRIQEPDTPMESPGETAPPDRTEYIFAAEPPAEPTPEPSPEPSPTSERPPPAMDAVASASPAEPHIPAESPSVTVTPDIIENRFIAMPPVEPTPRPSPQPSTPPEWSPLSLRPVEYTFIEPLIEKAARLMLGKEEGEPITLGELATITDINIYGGYVSNCFHGTDLDRPQYTGYGNLRSLEDLRTMTNLRSLRLQNQPLTDISPLAENQRLERIGIYNCNVSDISPLTALPRLQTIYLESTLVSDYSALSRINELRSLTILHEKGVKKITELGDISGLSVLDLSYTVLESLEGVENIPWLIHLKVSGTSVRDFSLLNDRNAFPRLTVFEISEDMVQYSHTLDRDDIEIRLFG